jgi:hypothetical protein
MAKPPGMRGKIQRCAAETTPILEQIPEDFPERDDGGRLDRFRPLGSAGGN